MTQDTDTHTFYIFAYGSLIFAPELPGRVMHTIPARLHGYRRSFCKISRSRSCLREESFDAFKLPARFSDSARNRSLALGTVTDPNGWIDGLLITYPRLVQREVIANLDRREGYSPIRTIPNGYARRRHPVALLNSGAEVEAIVYFWDEDPSGISYLGDDVSLSERAKALINATPIHPDATDDPLARGLYYMEGVRSSLERLTLVDAHLEEMAHEIHALPGPWTAKVAPPQPLS